MNSKQILHLRQIRQAQLNRQHNITEHALRDNQHIMDLIQKLENIKIYWGHAQKGLLTQEEFSRKIQENTDSLLNLTNPATQEKQGKDVQHQRHQRHRIQNKFNPTCLDCSTRKKHFLKTFSKYRRYFPNNMEADKMQAEKMEAKEMDDRFYAENQQKTIKENNFPVIEISKDSIAEDIAGLEKWKADNITKLKKVSKNNNRDTNNFKKGYIHTTKNLDNTPWDEIKGLQEI